MTAEDVVQRFVLAVLVSVVSATPVSARSATTTLSCSGQLKSYVDPGYPEQRVSGISLKVSDGGIDVAGSIFSDGSYPSEKAIGDIVVFNPIGEDRRAGSVHRKSPRRYPPGMVEFLQGTGSRASDNFHDLIKARTIVPLKAGEMPKVSLPPHALRALKPHSQPLRGS